MAPGAVADVRGTADLARLLRELRRRDARRRGGAELTYRELAAATGWSHGIIGGYLAGRVLPPTDRFDVLIRLLGASPAEQGALATARDRVEEHRRPAAAPPPAPAAALTVPRQLPADVPAFTGRTAPLAALDALLGAGFDTDLRAGFDAGFDANPRAGFDAGSNAGLGGTPGHGAPRVVLITGTAGVGKTALAVHWAHRIAGRFPDGQLHVDLRGYDPQQPADPGDALAGFLRGLGVPASGIPATTAERAARYRTEVAGRRLLVLLDNASSADQVRPLLPGTGPGMVVVTSRDALGGLVARDGAHPVHLSRLDRADSRALLRRLTGPGADAGTVDLLARRCAGLPLALRVAATRLPESPRTGPPGGGSPGGGSPGGGSPAAGD
ncbi:helix-turn-helix domain-containing protein, partial [Dactylosporangium sp. NPDC050688]|uniref:helix-turn-helix domain-containing protein n=1 Tax=Dactylosporangium sp. NPDC050688 TaxID=3157217 RepID=UPI0033DAEF77